MKSLWHMFVGKTFLAAPPLPDWEAWVSRSIIVSGRWTGTVSQMIAFTGLVAGLDHPEAGPLREILRNRVRQR